MSFIKKKPVFDNNFVENHQYYCVGENCTTGQKATPVSLCQLRELLLLGDWYYQSFMITICLHTY